MAFVTAVRGCECCWAVAIVAVWFHFLSSPDGSYTEEQSQEGEVKVLATDFDDEFDEEEPPARHRDLQSPLHVRR